MRIFLASVLILFACGAAWAEDAAMPHASLFFSPEEAHQAEMLAQKTKPPGQGDVNLGAVFYYAPDDWVLWLRGQEWTPQTSNDSIKIEQVTANEVRLLWKSEDGSGMRELVLQPDETFQISTGKIIRDQ